jgi:hypothetical protein
VDSLFQCGHSLTDQSLVPLLQNALLASLDKLHGHEAQPSKLSFALGRLYEVLSKGHKGDRAFLRDSVDRFVDVMRQRSEAKESISGQASENSGELPLLALAIYS